MPYTAVTRAVGADEPGQGSPDTGEALLVDVRYQVPLASALVAALVPRGARWLLGGPEVGYWRVESAGAAVDGLALLDVPVIADRAAVMPPIPDSTLPARLTLTLVPRRSMATVPDAILLDDAELHWSRTFLLGKPAAETAFLILGSGHHLLLAPGGLLSAVPFGVPLCHVGPGGLYVQAGRDFAPPLPQMARASLFPCPPESIVAVTSASDTGALRAERYALAQMLPVWTLWLGAAPTVLAGVSGAPARRLHQLAEAIEAQEAEPPTGMRRLLPRALRQQRPTDRERLLRQALAAQQAGEFVRAAGLLEEAGEPVAAGRLYERAAGG